MIFSHNWEGEPHNAPSVKRMMRPEDPYYTHEWMGEPHDSPSIRREIWPGDPEYTYAWEGEVGMSPSLKYRNGELVARNLSNAPAKVNDEYSSVAVEYTQEQFTYMSMIESQEGSTPYVGLTRMDVTPGEYFASGMDFQWGEGIGRVRHQIQFRGPNSESISAPQIQRDFSDYPEGGRSIIVERVPDGATEARIYTWFYIEGAYTAAPAGSTIHVGGYVNAKGSTEEEVRLQVEEPFDGDTKSHRGRIVATNLVGNPQYKEYGTEWRDSGAATSEVLSNGILRVTRTSSGSSYYTSNKGLLNSRHKYIGLRVPMLGEGRVWIYYQNRSGVRVLPQSQTGVFNHESLEDLVYTKEFTDEAYFFEIYLGSVNREEGSYVEFGTPMIVTANTQEEVTRQLEVYFDGDTPSEYGEVVSRNLFLNPRTVTDGSEFWGGQRINREYIIDDKLNAEVLSIKVSPFEEPEAYTIIISPPIDIGESVEYVSWGLDFRLFSGFTLLAARPSYRNSEGVRRYNSTTVFSIGEWGRHVVASKVPEGSYEYSLYLYLTPEGSLSPAPHPQTEIRLTNASFSYADTEEEALRQVETYFDGDTKDYALAKPKIWLTNRWVPFTPTHFM